MAMHSGRSMTVQALLPEDVPTIPRAAGMLQYAVSLSQGQARIDVL